MYPNYYQQPFMGQNFNPVYQPNGQMMNRSMGLAGRTVPDFDLITANDVPMDGSISVFPKADMSEIQVRRWNSNGQIEKTTYKPFNEPLDDKTNISSPDYLKCEFEDVRGQIGALHEEVVKVSEQISKIGKPQATKKEVTT